MVTFSLADRESLVKHIDCEEKNEGGSETSNDVQASRALPHAFDAASFSGLVVTFDALIALAPLVAEHTFVLFETRLLAAKSFAGNKCIRQLDALIRVGIVLDNDSSDLWINLLIALFRRD